MHEGTVTHGLALVDYDNLRWRQKQSKASLELDARTLVDDVAYAFAVMFPATRELDIRLYGGWTDSTGFPSRVASWFYELLPNLRGRRCGLIVRPALATTMIQFPEFFLRGTVRGGEGRQRQKMIDGMMGCDALHVATLERTYIGVVTDDDDLLPATLSAHAKKAGMLAWLRVRNIGSAINDSNLLTYGLRIHRLRTLSHVR